MQFIGKTLKQVLQPFPVAEEDVYIFRDTFIKRLQYEAVLHKR